MSKVKQQTVLDYFSFNSFSFAIKTCKDRSVSSVHFPGTQWKQHHRTSLSPFKQVIHLLSSTNNHSVTDPLAKGTLPTEKLRKLSQNNAGLQGPPPAQRRRTNLFHGLSALTEGSCPVSCSSHAPCALLPPGTLRGAWLHSPAHGLAQTAAVIKPCPSLF